jgi:hypothetical protein
VGKITSRGIDHVAAAWKRFVTTARIASKHETRHAPQGIAKRPDFPRGIFLTELDRFTTKAFLRGCGASGGEQQMLESALIVAGLVLIGWLFPEA